MGERACFDARRHPRSRPHSRPSFRNTLCRYCRHQGHCYQDEDGFFFCKDRTRCFERGRINKQKVEKKKKEIPKSPNYMVYKVMDKMLKSGYMKKRGYWNTSYKERYFRLWSNGKMTYFNGSEDHIANGHIQLSRGDVSVEMKTPVEFLVVTESRVWSFECLSTNDAKEWVDTICTLIGSAPIIKYENEQIDDVEQSQVLEPGMSGYEVVDLQLAEKDNEGMLKKDKNENGWEEDVPPPAYTSTHGGDAFVGSERLPSAPPEESCAISGGIASEELTSQ